LFSFALEVVLLRLDCPFTLEVNKLMIVVRDEPAWLVAFIVVDGIALVKLEIELELYELVDVLG
jgi:hypothetical protein